MTSNPSHPTDQGLIESVNVGAVRTVDGRGQRVRTGIWKTPVGGRVLVQGVKVEGDDQADRSVHGGLDKAVYAYGMEDYDWWAGQLGYGLGPGTFGENLTKSCSNSRPRSACSLAERLQAMSMSTWNDTDERE